MSRTAKTNKARTARKLIKVVNSSDPSEIASARQEIDALEIDGVRYGNQRKFRAAEKVYDRRAERRKANRAAKKDTDIG